MRPNVRYESKSAQVAYHRRPVVIAIVDAAGTMLSYACMDNCRTNPSTFPVRKACTAALSAQNYAERLKSQGLGVNDTGNPNLAAAQGAMVILHFQTGTVLGAIGVSGLAAQEDEDLSDLGVQALGL